MTSIAKELFSFELTRRALSCAVNRSSRRVKVLLLLLLVVLLPKTMQRMPCKVRSALLLLTTNSFIHVFLKPILSPHLSLALVNRSSRPAPLLPLLFFC